MAQFRQSGSDRFGGRSCYDSQSVGMNPITHRQGFRIRRIGGRSDKSNFKISVHAILLMIPLVALITIFGYHHIRGYEDLNKFHGQDDDWKNELGFLSNVTGINRFEVLNARIKRFNFVNFGRGLVMHGQDSRYWDRDDRRRGEEYNADMLELSNVNDHVKERSKSNQFSFSNIQEKSDGNEKFNYRSMGQYDETAKDEQLIDEAEYNDSLKNAKQSRREDSSEQEQSHSMILESGNEEVNSDNYSHDAHIAEYRDLHDDRDQLDIPQGHDEGIGEAFEKLRIGASNAISDKVFINKQRDISSRRAVRVRRKSKRISSIKGRSAKRTNPVKRPVLMRRPPIVHKSSGSSCEVKFLNSTAKLVEPSESPKFSRFSLQYTEVEEKPDGQEQWEPRFAGHQTLKEREESFYARDKRLNCGLVQGPKGSLSTGFDLAEDDARLMASCHIAVLSCIFGNSDYLRTPAVEMITRLSRKSVCFVMFTDENTLQTLSSEGQSPDTTGFIGLWKVVVVKNLPYSDMRRVGKIPKFLAHRLFPSARYSIWLDSKLLLQHDPLLILEYFLWRNDYEYAISNHYDRHCVWEEVVQNKKLNKYNHTSIDQQFLFYQADGLMRFNASDPNNLLPSNVPEGSFIVRAHTPMSNLFSCLWFNEVHRFTSRDQLSFAYVYHKLRRMNPGTPFYLNMFKDCERRAMTRLFHHRSEEKQNISLQGMGQNLVVSEFG